MKISESTKGSPKKIGKEKSKIKKTLAPKVSINVKEIKFSLHQLPLTVNLI